MARVSKKAKKIAENVYESDHSVDAFGSSLENVADANTPGGWNKVQQVAAHSKSNLEMDKGEGNVAVMRSFVFGLNPQAFQEARPSKQEIFNAHLKGIEISLWKDGLQIMTDVEPRIMFDVPNMRYTIFVGAKPAKGHILPWNVKPQTLSEIAHGKPTN